MTSTSKKMYYFILGAVCTLIFFLVFANFFFSKSNIQLASSFQDVKSYQVSPPTLPEKLVFSGEMIPVDNLEVYERMDREFLSNTFWHSATILAIKRSARWFPIIEPILRKNNIPDDFKYLAVAESNLDNVVSPAGAAGFWQFMEATGKKYGLEINDQVDERYNLEKATEAACKYLNESKILLGSWIAAAASYNMGQDGIRKQQEKQRSNNYFNLMLNNETYRFVGRIVSLKYILSDPVSFGFNISENHLYKPLEYKEVYLNSAINNLTDYAESQGINYLTLKLFNPWLRSGTLSNKAGKTYTIKLPKEGTIKLIN